MIKKVFMARPTGPGSVTAGFQQELLGEYGCTIGNNIPHLHPADSVTEGDIEIWWKGVEANPDCFFILPVHSYPDSMKFRIETYKSFIDHGRPLNVLLYPVVPFSEPFTGSRNIPASFTLMQTQYARAMAYGMHPFITHPFPVPDMPVIDWLIPRNAGWWLSMIEKTAHRYGKQFDLVVQKACYLASQDFPGLDYGMVGERIKKVAENWPKLPLPFLLIHDETDLPYVFEKDEKGEYHGFTDDGKALMNGCV